MYNERDQVEIKDQWEYDVLLISASISKPETLNKIGIENWELISVVYIENRDELRYYFKRKI